MTSVCRAWDGLWDWKPYNPHSCLQLQILEQSLPSFFLYKKNLLLWWCRTNKSKSTYAKNLLPGYLFSPKLPTISLHRLRYHSLLSASQKQPSLTVSLTMLWQFHQQHPYHKPMALLLNAGFCAKCFICSTSFNHETVLEVGITINSISQTGKLMLRNVNLCIQVHTPGVTKLGFNPSSAWPQSLCSKPLLYKATFTQLNWNGVPSRCKAIFPKYKFHRCAAKDATMINTWKCKCNHYIMFTSEHKSLIA